ncbi:MAG: cytochrome c biogenesis protein ResB [Proteobacteria bacterium]|nr:cytochrome c biogenesis protein ResB [Pseudomonadota bacterium]
MDKIKKILLDINYSFYALVLASFFCILGSFIVYFNPKLYNTIDYKALFKWLYYNQSIKNFWLYLVTIIFVYLGISGFYCLIYDFKRKNIFTLIFHLSFLLILVAHLINSIYFYKVSDYIIPEGVPKTINLPESDKPIRVFLDKLNYDITNEGFIKNLKADLIYLEKDEQKSGKISINNPLKIEGKYLILKQASPFLRSITFKLRSEERLIIPVLTPEGPFNIDGVLFQFLAHNEDMSAFKVLVIDGDKKETMIWSLGQNVNIKGQSYTITQIIPDTIGSIVVDIVYDPSVYLIFFASTLFVFTSVIRFFEKG